MSDTDTKPATRMRRRYPVSNGELVVTGAIHVIVIAIMLFAAGVAFGAHDYATVFRPQRLEVIRAIYAVFCIAMITIAASVASRAVEHFRGTLLWHFVIGLCMGAEIFLGVLIILMVSAIV